MEERQEEEHVRRGGAEGRGGAGGPQGLRQGHLERQSPGELGGGGAEAHPELVGNWCGRVWRQEMGPWRGDQKEWDVLRNRFSGCLGTLGRFGAGTSTGNRLLDPVDPQTWSWRRVPERPLPSPTLSSRLHY